MKANDIRKLRLGLELSQERFARLLGVALQTVRRWEEGLAKPLPIISLKLEELQKEAGQAQRGAGGVDMSEGRKRGAGGVEFDLGGLFRGLGNLFEQASRMSAQGTEEYTHSGVSETLGGKAKVVYGFTMRMGLGGKPVIEQFGNIRATEEGTTVAEVREPLVDVLDEGDRVVVIAELPGVEDKDIHLQVNGDILEISAEARDRKYSKEVLLPSPVNADTMESSYRNGIVEIKLRKRK